MKILATRGHLPRRPARCVGAPPARPALTALNAAPIVPTHCSPFPLVLQEPAPLPFARRVLAPTPPRWLHTTNCACPLTVNEPPSLPSSPIPFPPTVSCPCTAPCNVCRRRTSSVRVCWSARLPPIRPGTMQWVMHISAQLCRHPWYNGLLFNQQTLSREASRGGGRRDCATRAQEAASQRCCFKPAEPACRQATCLAAGLLTVLSATQCAQCIATHAAKAGARAWPSVVRVVRPTQGRSRRPMMRGDAATSAGVLRARCKRGPHSSGRPSLPSTKCVIDSPGWRRLPPSLLLLFKPPHLALEAAPPLLDAQRLPPACSSRSSTRRRRRRVRTPALA